MILACNLNFFSKESPATFGTHDLGGVNYVAIILVQKTELLPHFYSVVAYNMIGLKIAFTVDSCPSATRIGCGSCNADTGHRHRGVRCG